MKPWPPHGTASGLPPSHCGHPSHQRWHCSWRGPPNSKPLARFAPSHSCYCPRRPAAPHRRPPAGPSILPGPPPIVQSPTDLRRNPLDQQRWACDRSHCAGISAGRVTNHAWLEAVLQVELASSKRAQRLLVTRPQHSHGTPLAGPVYAQNDFQSHQQIGVNYSRLIFLSPYYWLYYAVIHSYWPLLLLYFCEIFYYYWLLLCQIPKHWSLQWIQYYCCI